MTDAWKGLLSTLHTSGRDQEALAQIQQIPIPVRRILENDVEYLQTIGNVYSSLGQPQQSMVFLNRVQQHYANAHAVAPADIDIQNAYLLFNGSNDTGLYRQLMILGGRQDLTDEQRRTVQTIWSLWAARRANAAAAAGNNKRALAILNAAARAFPDNPGVLKALASGYARAGLPKQAVAIFKAQDMTSASANDYKAAVGAALSAGDTKSAELWLRYGLNQYPRDAQMLILGAKFEQARGDNNRAAEYYKASLAAMPPPDPGAELANELSRPMPSTANRLPSQTQSQDLASLLGPGAGQDNLTAEGSEAAEAPVKPYLPGYANAYGSAPVDLSGNGGLSQQGAQTYGQYTPLQQGFGNAVPAYMTNPDQLNPAYPAQQSRTNQPAANKRSGTLGDYVPRAEQPAGGYVMPQQTPTQPLLLPDDSPNHSQLLSPPGAQGEISEYQRQQIARLTRQAQSQSAYADAAGSSYSEHAQVQQQGPLTYAPVQSAPVPDNQSRHTQSSEVYGPYVPYVPPVQNSLYTPTPVPVQLGDATPRNMPPQREVTDVLPTAKYVPNSKSKRRTMTSSHPDIAEAEAGSARRRQSNPNLGMTGQSNPPLEDLSAPPTQNTQYVLPLQQGQITQPRALPQAADAGQAGDNFGQQYPQPAAAPSTRKRAPAQTQRATTIANQPGMIYPGVAQPLTYQPYPVVGPAAAQGVPPTDAELVARLVPPLRGGYDPVAKPVGPPLTAREQTELDLATLEASYSAWVGGTGYARYRSGTVGFDRLTDFEASFEASVVAAKKARFTVVAKPVFLSNGTVDTATLSASTGIIPVLGTLPGNATATPAQQSASGSWR